MSNIDSRVRRLEAISREKIVPAIFILNEGDPEPDHQGPRLIVRIAGSGRQRPIAPTANLLPKGDR